MATVTSTLTVEAKNELLRHLSSMQLHDEGETANKIAVVNSQGGYAGTKTFAFGSPLGGVIDISENIVIEISAGQTVAGIRYIKSNPYGDDNVINSISITPTVAFPYGGKIVITQLKVTLT